MRLKNVTLVLAFMLVGCGGPQGRPGGTTLSGEEQVRAGDEEAKEAAVVSTDGGSAAEGDVELSRMATGSFTAPGTVERARVRKVVLPDAEQDPECRGGQYCGSIKCRADIVLEGSKGQKLGTHLLEHAIRDGEGGLSYEILRTVPLGDTGRDGLVIRRDDGYHTVASTLLYVVQAGADGAKILWRSHAMGEYESEGDSRLPGIDVVAASPEKIVVVWRGEIEGTKTYPAPMYSQEITLSYQDGKIIEQSRRQKQIGKAPSKR
jgi:uncharacterized lipoprotein YehR (DUF1307 family)